MPPRKISLSLHSQVAETLPGYGRMEIQAVRRSSVPSIRERSAAVGRSPETPPATAITVRRSPTMDLITALAFALLLWVIFGD